MRALRSPSRVSLRRPRRGPRFKSAPCRHRLRVGAGSVALPGATEPEAALPGATEAPGLGDCPVVTVNLQPNKPARLMC
jgi:hypothetical protein